MSIADRRIFEEIGNADESQSACLDFLAYACFACEKYDWYDKFEERHGRHPDADEIEAWIEQITPLRFRNYRESALSFFNEAVNDCLGEKIQDASRKAIRDSFLAELQATRAGIVSEVRATGAFWKQMCLALVTAILAPLMLGALAAAILGWNKASAFLDHPTPRPGYEAAPSPP